MPQTRACDVSPTGDQELYTVAFVSEDGHWFGLDVKPSAILASTINNTPPQEAVSMTSYHGGRGADRWESGQNFYDNQDGWRTTPGRYHSTLLWEFGQGLRNEDMSFPASNGVTFKKLYGSTRSISVSLSATASYNAAQVQMIIRKGVAAGTVGQPGTLSVELCQDNAGSPGTVLRTVTISATDVSDVVSRVYTFSFSSVQAVSASTTYHLKIYGGSGDTQNACWEVGCNPSAAGKISSSPTSGFTASVYSPYYRMTDAEVDKRLVPFNFEGSLYAISVFDSEAVGSLYINGTRGKATSATTTTLVDTGSGSYSTAGMPVDAFVNWKIRIIRGTGQGQVRTITANNTTSFTVADWDKTPDTTSEYIVYGGTKWVILYTFSKHITGKPVVSQGIVYFPMGDSEPFAAMTMDYTQNNDHNFDLQTETGTRGDAYFLAAGFDSATNSPSMYRANLAAGTGSGGKGTVSRAPLTAATVYTTDLVFATAVQPGENTYQITNLFFYKNKVYVGKENSLFAIENDRPIEIETGAQFRPWIHNFKAWAVAPDQNLMVSQGQDVNIIAGGASFPTGLMKNLPTDRVGYVSDMASAEGWVFACIDAGTGTSSVMLWANDAQSWGEHLRAWQSGKKMRAIAFHPCPETFPELWVSVGQDIVRQQLPRNGTRPIADTGCRYWHETVLELAEIDLNRTDEKFISTLQATTENMTTSKTQNTGSEIIVESQTDEEVRSSTWHYEGKLASSPIDTVRIEKGKVGGMSIRLRLISSSATLPVILKNLRVSVVSAGSIYHRWQLQFTVWPDDDDQPPVELVQWLIKMAKEKRVLTMKSTIPLYHDRKVVLADEPFYVVDDYAADDEELEARLSVVAVEVV